MTYEQQFIIDFEVFINTQAEISEKALHLATESNNLEAATRYESRLDAYRFLQSKFENYHAGKAFDELANLTTKKF